jgi:glucokinase-like ROK family protein
MLEDGAMPTVLGIDIGGTNIAWGVVDRRGRILGGATLPSEGALGKAAVLRNLDRIMERVRNSSSHPIAAIGIGTAGEVDPQSGVITSATDNIPHWAGTRLKEYVQEKSGLPTYVDNDGNAAALAELQYGAGRGLKNFVYLSLGTGVGGAVIVDGHLLRGTRNYAAALGHTTMDVAGLPCNCGSTGCLEMYVSGTAIARSARAGNVASDARELFEKAKQGEQEAIHLVDQVSFYLGCGLANFANQFDPEAIIIGGGVSQAGSLLLEPAKATMDARVLQGLEGKVQVLAAEFGSEAGLLGGAVVAFHGLGHIGTKDASDESPL